MRKKKSEMTIVEQVEKALKGRTLKETEEAGVEIIARCIAIHVYEKGEGEEFLDYILTAIAERAVQWAKDNELAEERAEIIPLIVNF